MVMFHAIENQFTPTEKYWNFEFEIPFKEVSLNMAAASIFLLTSTLK